MTKLNIFLFFTTGFSISTMNGADRLPNKQSVLKLLEINEDRGSVIRMLLQMAIDNQNVNAYVFWVQLGRQIGITLDMKALRKDCPKPFRYHVDAYLKNRYENSESKVEVSAEPLSEEKISKSADIAISKAVSSGAMHSALTGASKDKVEELKTTIVKSSDEELIKEIMQIKKIKKLFDGPSEEKAKEINASLGISESDGPIEYIKKIEHYLKNINEPFIESYPFSTLLWNVIEFAETDEEQTVVSIVRKLLQRGANRDLIVPKEGDFGALDKYKGMSLYGIVLQKKFNDVFNELSSSR